MSWRRKATTLAVVTTLVACVPDLGDRDSLIKGPTILAVRGEPPEAALGASVHYDLLVATPDGAVQTPLARWSYCAAGKLLGENGAVSASCLRADGSVAIAEGPAAVDSPMPSNACSVFGPQVTSQDLRPRDPDITGGYYQPVRVDTDSQIAFGLERIACPLGIAPSDIVIAFGQQYKKNQNPAIDPIAVPTAARGKRLTLRATWPDTSPEPYVVYNRASKVLENHRESMRVSWFATAGTFDSDRTGRAEEEPELFTENGWTAPDAAGPVHFFAILRDPRGGVAFVTWDTIVE